MTQRETIRSYAGRPRVAIQLISTGGIYGAERTLLELATYLRDQGWDSRIIALEGNGAAELTHRAAEHGIACEAFVPAGRLGLLPMIQRLRATLAGESRAIVHSHGYKPDILLAALDVPRRLPCLATCHSWYSSTAKLRALEYLDKWAVRRFDQVIAVSEEIYRDLLANGTPEASVSKIDNGISVPILGPHQRTKIRAEWNIPPGGKLIVQIGRLAKSKRNALLLAAVAQLPNDIKVTVALVGDGEERTALAEYARRLGIEGSVIFAGYRNDAAGVMAAADVLVITSDKEGLPIVVLEAMVIGCPVITTTVGAIPQVLSPDSAWLIPVDDEAALVEALREALSETSAGAARAVKAKAIFHKSFSRDVMGQQYLARYERAWRARGWA